MPIVLCVFILFCFTEFFFGNFFLVYSDAAVPWQLGLQDPATPIAEGIFRFHHDLMFILIFVVVFVCWILFRILQHFNISKNPYSSGVVHGTLIEVVWTILPAFFLMLIAVPSFALLYSVDEIVDPALTVKIVGHQWYWSYEYSDYYNSEDVSLNFDSYMLPSDDLVKGHLRLLEVDNRVILPVETHVRLIITAADVLHCWAVPSFGIKLDACPGRLNQASLFIQRPGVFYGQCSEICGVNHGFIPISIEAVVIRDYVLWVSNKLSDFLFGNSFLMFLYIKENLLIL